MAQDKQQNKYSGIGSIGVGGQSILKGILGSILGAGQDEETLTPEMVLPKKDSIDAGDAVDMRRMLEMIHKGDLFPEDRDKNGQPIIRGETMHIEATSPYLKQGKPLDKIPHDEPIPQPDLGIAPSNVDLNKLMLPPVIPTLAKQPQKAKVAPNVWETKTPADINTPLLTPNQPTTQTSGVDSIHKGDETKVAPKIEGVGEPSQQDFMSALAAAPHQSVSMPIGGGASGTVEQGKPLSKEPGKHNVAEKILGGLLHALIGKIGADQNRPQLTAPVNSDEYYRQRQLQTSYDAAHPKYHGILGTIGNIAGDMIAPNIMANIPGTVANQEIRAEGEQEGLNRDLALQGEQAKIHQEQTAADKNVAETGKAKIEAYKLLHPDAKEEPIVSEGKIVGFKDSKGIVDPKDYTPAMKATMEASSQAQQEGKNHIFSDSDRNAINQRLTDRYQVLNPGKPLPDQYKLKSGQGDREYKEIDADLRSTEQATGTKAQQESTNALRQQTAALTTASRNSAEEARNASLNERSYDARSRELEESRKPVDEELKKLSTAATNVNLKTAQADALVAPELLSVMAGGAGSGLRMNDAEIKRIVGGRSSVEDFKAMLNKMSNGLTITDEQRDQVRQVLGYAQKKVNAKVSIMQKAKHDLIDATDASSQRSIVAGVQDRLEAIDQGNFLSRDQAAKMDVKQPGSSQALISKGWVLY